MKVTVSEVSGLYCLRDTLMKSIAMRIPSRALAQEMADAINCADVLISERDELHRKLVDAAIRIHDLEEHQHEREQSLANLCDNHRRKSLPVPTANACQPCMTERETRRRVNVSEVLV